MPLSLDQITKIFSSLYPPPPTLSLSYLIFKKVNFNLVFFECVQKRWGDRKWRFKDVEREARKIRWSSPEPRSLAKQGSVLNSLTESGHHEMAQWPDPVPGAGPCHFLLSGKDPAFTLWDLCITQIISRNSSLFFNPVTFFNSHQFFSFPMCEIKKYLGKQFAQFYKNNLLVFLMSQP